MPLCNFVWIMMHVEILGSSYIPTFFPYMTLLSCNGDPALELKPYLHLLEMYYVALGAITVQCRAFSRSNYR
jgi:hypothetical protein